MRTSSMCPEQLAAFGVSLGANAPMSTKPSSVLMFELDVAIVVSLPFT